MQFSIDDRHLFHEIIEPLAKTHPRAIYDYLKNAIANIVNQTAMASVFDDYLIQDTTFTGYHSRDNHCRKLMKLLLQILKGELSKDARFVKNEIQHFLSTDSGTLYRIALEVMLESPTQFVSETFGLCKCHELIEYLLDNQREGYYFKKLLKASYPHFTAEQQLQIQQNALSFISEREKIFVKERRYMGHPILPSLGKRQRAFIYSLPEEELSLALRHKKDELDRRIPWKYENKKSSDHIITAAHLCGGLVSDSIYERFSLKNWKTSFLKLPHSQHRWDYHLSMNTHIQKFSECVQKNPARFCPFVLNMFDNERVQNQFRLAGLRGLAEANYRIDNLYPLFLQLSKQITDNELLEMVEIAELFIKFKSKYTSEISDYLISIIKKEYISVYNPEKENESTENDRISGLLTKGINTIQGYAIKAFIENAVFDSRRSYVYETFLQLVDVLSIEHKLAVLYRIYHQKVYDEALFDKLLVAYLQHGVSEFLNARGNIIHGYLSCKPDLVTPYLRSVADLARSQKTLGILSYLGAVYGVKICNDMLESKLNDGNVEFADGALTAAFANFSHPSCNDLSLSVINKVADSSDESIIKLFSYRFSKLDSKNFPAVKDAFYKCISKTAKLKGAIDYLEKCCAEYPKECYDCLDTIIKNGGNSEYGMDREEQIELLFAIYKYLTGSPDIQEKIMDTFDYVLKESVGGYGIHKILASVTE
ncbi:MAG: hypothetical protein LBR68_01120 [Lachnoclostridium sp.]|nr:hypothetical protein [Lachnoclostridium sp.]